MSDPIEPDKVMPPQPDPKKAAHRTKAHKLRTRERQGEELTAEEADWLEAFKAAQTDKSGKPRHAYAAARRVFHMEEENTQAEGDAASPAAAASAPAVSRNEGRRLDYIIDLLLRSQQQVVVMYSKMAEQILQRNAQMEDVHLSMLDSIREHYIARIEAESENILLKPEEKENDTLLEDVARGMMAGLANKNGVKLPGGNGG